MKELIEDIKSKKPIQVICSGYDLGIYQYNEDKNRYEGMGFLAIETIKDILRGEIDYIELRRIDNEICNRKR